VSKEIPAPRLVHFTHAKELALVPELLLDAPKALGATLASTSSGDDADGNGADNENAASVPAMEALAASARDESAVGEPSTQVAR